MSPDKDLRSHLLELLDGGSAHLKPSQVLKGFPAKARGAKAAGVPYSPWQLLEHMRIAQWDILEFSRNPKHVSPPYPEGYWPSGDAPRKPAGVGKQRRSLPSRSRGGEAARLRPRG